MEDHLERGPQAMEHEDAAADTAAVPAPSLPMRESDLKLMLQEGTSVKFNSEAFALTSTLIGAFVMEAVHRSSEEAASVNAREISPEHLEKVLPQLLLDLGP